MRYGRLNRFLVVILITFTVLVTSAAPTLATTNQPIEWDPPAVTNASKLAVTGKAPGARQVTVGGSKATVDALGNFTAELNLNWGTNQVEVLATDSMGNASRLKRTITVDPSLVPMFSTDGTVDWSGKIAPGSQVTYDGKPVTLSADGTYWVTLSLVKAGTNTFRLDFITEGEAYYHQVFVMNPLNLKVPSHTNLSSLTLAGDTGSTFDLTFQGKVFQVDTNGAFQVVTNLELGANGFTFQVAKMSAPWTEAIVTPSGPVSVRDWNRTRCNGQGEEYYSDSNYLPLAVVCGGVYYQYPGARKITTIPGITRFADWSELPPYLMLPPKYGGSSGVNLYSVTLAMLPTTTTAAFRVVRIDLPSTVKEGLWTLPLPNIAPGTTFILRGTATTATETTRGAAVMQVPVRSGYQEIIVDYRNNGGQPAFMLFGINVVKSSPLIELTIGSDVAKAGGDLRQLPVPPQIIGGNTFVPLRFVAEALGADLNYDLKTRTIRFDLNGHSVVLTVGAPTAVVDGVEKELPAPAQIMKDSTMVPLQFFSESLGAKLRWNSPTQTQTVTLTLGDLPPETAGTPTGISQDQIRTALGIAQANANQMPGIFASDYIKRDTEAAIFFQTEYMQLVYKLWQFAAEGVDLTEALAAKKAAEVRGSFVVMAMLRLPKDWRGEVVATLSQGGWTTTSERVSGESPRLLDLFPLGPGDANSALYFHTYRFNTAGFYLTQPVVLYLAGPSGQDFTFTFYLQDLR